MRYSNSAVAAAALSGLLTTCCFAADWNLTEVQYKYGRLDRPEFAGGGTNYTDILTIKHAKSWKYGDLDFFVDMLDSGDTVFNNSDAWVEAYFNFSLGKITGKHTGFGPVDDVGILFGINYAADENVQKYLPGVRFSLWRAGLAFANLDLTAYIDNNGAKGHGGTPAEDDSFMIDFNWAYPFSVGGQDFSIECRQGLVRCAGTIVAGFRVPVLAEQARRQGQRRIHHADPRRVANLIREKIKRPCPRPPAAARRRNLFTLEPNPLFVDPDRGLAVDEFE